jgi:hypothetical protein
MLALFGAKSRNMCRNLQRVNKVSSRTMPDGIKSAFLAVYGDICGFVQGRRWARRLSPTALIAVPKSAPPRVDINSFGR